MNTLEALEAAKAAPGDRYELTDLGVTYWIRYLRHGHGWRITSNDGAEPGHSAASILPQADGWVRIPSDEWPRRIGSGLPNVPQHIRVVSHPPHGKLVVVATSEQVSYFLGRLGEQRILTVGEHEFESTVQRVQLGSDGVDGWVEFSLWRVKRA